MQTIRHYEAVPTSVPDVRADVALACRDAGLLEAAYQDLLVAVSEAATNVVRHSGAPTFGVEVEIADGGVTVVVADLGIGVRRQRSSGMPAPEAYGGRGLPLMEALVDECEFESSAAGTRVVLRQGIGQRAES